MQQFSNERFPLDISYGATGGPEFATNIITTTSGHEYRNSNWQQARAKYDISYGVKTQEQVLELISFFRSMRGQATAFRFKDFADYSATNQLIGIGDGVNCQFQLTKKYGSYTRKITKPVAESLEVFGEMIPSLEMGAYSQTRHAELVSASQELRAKELHETLKPVQGDELFTLPPYHLDENTGIITFTEAPKNDKLIYANFEFDVPVRFDSDHLNTSIDDYKHYSVNDINLVEVKE